jgi:hypothetical protein
VCHHPEVPEAPEVRGHRGPAATATLWGLFLAISVAACAGLFVARYVERGDSLPVGYDTPKYVWRVKLTAQEGLEALPGAAPLPQNTNPDRPGYPILASLVSAAVGIDPIELALLLPALFAALTGLAAGALARSILREPGWAFPVYAVATGTSVNVSLTAIGYADNLVLLPVLLLAAAIILRAELGPGPLAATAITLGAAASLHWPFTGAFLALMGLVALLRVGASLRERRTGVSLLRTESARMGGLVAAGIGVAVATFLLVFPAPPDRLPGHLREFRTKLRAKLPLYHLPFAGPVAAGGAVALGFGRDPRRRRGLLFLVAWVALAVVGLVALSAGLESPAHRLLGFALALPILAAAGLVGLTRLLGRRLRAVGWVVGAAVTIAGLAVGATWGWAAWERERVWLTPGGLAQTEIAGRYLEQLGNDDLVVFVVDTEARQAGITMRLVDRSIRAGLPASQIRLARLYLGDWQNALAGEITLRGTREFDRVSRIYWEDVQQALGAGSVILVLDAYYPGFREFPPTVVGPGVNLARGPEPGNALVASPEAEPPTVAWFAGGVILLLLLLGVVGSGWMVALSREDAPVRVALAPVMGVAVLVVAGAVTDRVGPAVGGLAGRVVVVVATLAGWAIVGATWLARRSRPGPGDRAAGEGSLESTAALPGRRG